jgi:hypothetical protein
MLSAFQSRTGQKFPRTPLPVFEVVQELRKVEACVFIACDNCIQRANFLVQVYITRYSKRTDPVASVALVGATSTALPSFAVIAILFPYVQPFASRRCVVACCLDTSFRTSRACLQKRGTGSRANREAHAGHVSCSASRMGKYARKCQRRICLCFSTIYWYRVACILHMNRAHIKASDAIR